MEVQQTTFYEAVASRMEQNLSQIDELGVINALVTFKNAGSSR
jgi:hypothetical protein